MTDEGRRRVLRANALLAELGNIDILDALEELRRRRQDAAPPIVLTEVPVVVDFDTDAAQYRVAIVRALLEAGAPITHPDGRVMHAPEKIRWLGDQLKALKG